jgi:hypothetical protein
MDENTEILKEILKVQKEQNVLLRSNLTRIKYSLWTLLLLFTGSSILLGIYSRRSTAPTPTAATTITWQGLPAAQPPTPKFNFTNPPREDAPR